MSIEPSHDKPLKDLIESSGHTQTSLSKSLGVALSTVGYYVAGRKVPSAVVLADMCRVLNQSPKTVLRALGIDTAGIPDDFPPN